MLATSSTPYGESSYTKSPASGWTHDIAVSSTTATATAVVIAAAHYTGDQYIKWQDLEIVVQSTGELVDDVELDMRAALLNQKGNKYVCIPQKTSC